MLIRVHEKQDYPILIVSYVSIDVLTFIKVFLGRMSSQAVTTQAISPSGPIAATFDINPLVVVRFKTLGLLQTLSISKQTLLLGAILCLLQAADGVLTYLGILRFGTIAEGNPILRGLIVEIGAFPALLLVKLIAILAVIALVSLSRNVIWIKPALAGISLFYTTLAIIPWTWILFVQSVNT